MICIGYSLFIIGLIALAVMWPPILIFYIIFGGLMLIDNN
jgi:hypothetical protein